MKKIKNKIEVVILGVLCVFFLLTNNVYAVNSTNVGNNSGNTTNTSSTNTTSNSNANLSNLGIKPNDFKGFVKTKTEYDVTVPKTTEEIEVYATAESNSASVKGTGKVKLVNGKNTVEVVVTAKDGTTNKYTLNITRGETGDENAHVNDGLKSLKINELELTPEFNTNTYEYSVKYIGEADTLNIVTEVTDDTYKVEVVGNEKLIEGENTITILVSDKNGDNVATYQITVNKSLVDTEAIQREENEKKEKIIIGVAIGVGVILLLIIVCLIIKHIRKNKDYDYEDEEEYEDEEFEYENNKTNEKEKKESLNYEDEVPKALLKNKSKNEEIEYWPEEDKEDITEQDIDKVEDIGETRVYNIENLNEEKINEIDDRERIKKEFLDNYNSNNYEEYEDERPKRQRHKGKRFK